MANIKLKLQKLNNALSRLEEVYLDPPGPKLANIDSTIKRFEFTFELLWKCLREILADEGIETNSPKSTLIAAYSSGLLENEKLWLQMHKDRNLTVHAYDRVIAEQIFSNIKQYVPAIRAVVDRLGKLNL